MSSHFCGFFPGAKCSDVMLEVAGYCWKNWNLSGLGNQEIEAREIVAAEESRGIREGKGQKKNPKF